MAENGALLDLSNQNASELQENELNPNALNTKPDSLNGNGNGSDSSEAELLLANEEDQEIDLQFVRGEAIAFAATSDDQPNVDVQQYARMALTTRASRTDDALKPEGAEIELIECLRTSMLTIEEEFDEVSEGSIEKLERRKRLIATAACVCIGTVLVAFVARRVFGLR